MSDTTAKKTTAYTITLLFPKDINPTDVTQLDFKVTSSPATKPPLKKNQMPACIEVNDTIKFTYQKKNPGVKIKSCLLTRYNVDTSTKETDANFENEFDQAIPVTESFIGTWIFHMLGLYKSNNKQAAYYLDPEATFGTG
jgi:hypothetical protein